jgi:predicted DCC family thiol-disulfide oxidoreductase YuxK
MAAARDSGVGFDAALSQNEEGQDGAQTVLGVMPSSVLFDGVCNLCNDLVRFVIARDPARRFRFAPLQSDAAQRLIQEAGGGIAATDSLVLIEAENAQLYVRSAAALRIARRLRWPWPLLYLFIVVPRPVRDWVYDVVARHRYQWFGKRDVCMTPTAETTGRFL